MVEYDIAFLGNYTKDTIISAAGTRVVDGGAFNYGAHVAARMGLRVAAITHLAREDWRVVEALRALGVDLFAGVTPTSTCLRLEYPTSNPDERRIEVTSYAGPFSPAEVADIQARTFVLGPSFRGEVGLEVIEALAAKGARIAVDVQGWVRVVREGRLAYEAWPEAGRFLSRVSIVKADAVEATSLTGEVDLHRAARRLAHGREYSAGPEGREDSGGPEEIVLTHRDGLLVLAEGRFHEAGFFPVPAEGTRLGRSGRGDTCLAAYAAKRLQAAPEEATVWAAAVTSLKLEAEGPFRRDIGEVEALIQHRYGSPGDSPPASTAS